MIIRGTGCCLIDYLYAKVDFSSPAFAAARSRREGDGGLTPGRLVFAEDFQRFMGVPYEEALLALTGGARPSSHNLGGPSVVALVHAAQLLSGKDHQVHFRGVRGEDATGTLEAAALSRLPLTSALLETRSGSTPRTDVLSDPAYDNNHGERTFINLIGAAAELRPADLGDSFFDADILAFGGTALVPPLHDGLTGLLKKARQGGAVTVVNLVYDFRSELTAPGKKWRLGLEDDAYGHIDLLSADREEALKTSGATTTEAAVEYFLRKGAGAVVVTEGARSIHLASRGGIFAPLPSQSMPVCREISRELAEHPEGRGDTTGCGDNFAGGLLANMAEQLAAAGTSRHSVMDLREACLWAVVSGGLACFTVGGTYYENRLGEKRELLLPYLEAFRRQLAQEGL